jgi:hypothetical protein
VPEKALPGTVTNSGQPLVAVGQPATEIEAALAGRAVPVVNVTATGSPAVE